MSVMPKVWSRAQVEADAAESKKMFRKERIAESDTVYVEYYARDYKRVRYVMAATENLTMLREKMSELISGGYYDVVRYLPSPAVSEDDMVTVCELDSKAMRKLAEKRNSERIANYVVDAVDKERFPWVEESREPTETEKKAALMATATMMASQRVMTARRNVAKRQQEGSLKKYLKDVLGYSEVPVRQIVTAFDAPKPREFCGEASVVGKKADVVIGLGDNRFMCIECKVSNSEVNSIKRLNHETIEKCTHWYNTQGTHGVVCAALLSGVFSVDNVLQAQDDKVSIFWSHDLDSLGKFIESTYEK